MYRKLGKKLNFSHAFQLNSLKDIIEMTVSCMSVSRLQNC